MTSIYLMKDEPTGYYKIGRSYNPEQREITLLAQAPGISLICYWVDKQNAVEKWLHERYKKQRRRGEWFQLDERQLLDLYFIPALNKYGCVDVVLPDKAFLSKLLIKSCVWAIRAAQNRREGVPQWMEPINRETERLFP